MFAFPLTNKEITLKQRRVELEQLTTEANLECYLHRRLVMNIGLNIYGSNI